jgi:hypothetical protein
MLLKTNIKRTRILGVMLFPSAAVKQKAKDGLVGLGGALNVRFICHKQKPIENLCKSIITDC